MKSLSKWILMAIIVTFCGCSKATESIKTTTGLTIDGAVTPTIVQIEADETGHQLTIRWEIDELSASLVSGFEILTKPPGEPIISTKTIKASFDKRSISISNINILDKGEGEYSFQIRANNLDLTTGTLSRPFVYTHSGYKSSINFWGSNSKLTVSRPGGVYVSQEGHVFLADTGNNRIIKLDESGEVLDTYGKEGGEKGTGLGEFFSPKGLTMDNDGNIVVADSNNDRIVRFDPDDFKNTFKALGSYGTQLGEFVNPTDVLVLQDGSILVTDTDNARIQKITFTSASQWTTPNYVDWAGKNIVTGPWKMTATSKSILVVDTAASKIVVFNLEGQKTLSWQGMKDPRGIEYNEQDGHIYITDATEDTIWVYDTTGTYISKWGITGEDPGEFDEPSDIAISGSKLYISESANNRIQIFE